MPQTHAFWEDSSVNTQHIKYESPNSHDDHPRLKDDRGMYNYCDSNLNFATAPCSEDECDFGSIHCKKNKVARQDPMSHRIIEKRRRDRMNNCLADLSRLIPTEYLKKGRGRIEKTEIIEMAIQYMKNLQQVHVNPTEHYRLGYQECTTEALRFLIEEEGHFHREPMCVRLLDHLQKHCEPPQSPTKENTTPDLFKTAQDQDYPHLHKSHDEPNNNEFEDIIDDDTCLNSNATKHTDANESVSYKYKSDIKKRFSQDVTSLVKKLKLEGQDGDIRRTSTTSSENFSLESSPGSYDVPRMYENGSSGNCIPRGYHFKIDMTRKHSPAPGTQLLQADLKNNFNIPIFVLHSKGAYYIPATIDYFTLLPFLHNCNVLEDVSNINNVLHPVTINVNFQPLSVSKCKSDFIHNNDWQ